VNLSIFISVFKQNVAGKHTLHEITSRNGEWVCEYAVTNYMKIISIYYQHKRIHKGIWISPDELGKSDMLKIFDKGMKF